MPKKSKKRINKGKNKTKKQKLIVMIGCSKKSKKKSFFSNLGNKHHCAKCGRKHNRQRGGSGCGSCGCPIAPMSTKVMDSFSQSRPVIISPNENGYQPILGVSQRGGNCSTCGQMTGGSDFYKQIGPMPGPFVGNAWEPNSKLSPMGGDHNYLKPYDLSNDPSTKQMPSDVDAGYLDNRSLVGGYRYNKKLSRPMMYRSVAGSKKGGGLVPQDLVNLGRDFSYNFKTAYNALNGYKAPVDPAPYKGQLTGLFSKNWSV